LPGYDPATNRFLSGQQYDTNGNLTYDGVPGIPGNSYAWDAEGNLYQFTPTQGSTITMTYDALVRIPTKKIIHSELSAIKNGADGTGLAFW
jgi:hypothetical protein